MWVYGLDWAGPRWRLVAEACEKHVTCVQQSASPKPTVITAQNTWYRNPNYNIRTSAVWRFQISYSLRTARTEIRFPRRETAVSAILNARIYLPKVFGIVTQIITYEPHLCENFRSHYHYELHEPKFGPLDAKRQSPRLWMLLYIFLKYLVLSRSDHVTRSRCV